MNDRAEDFVNLWQQFGQTGIVWEREYVFHDQRRWRIDLMHLPSKVGVEIEGVVFFGQRKSRHQTAAGYMKDCEKYNAAIEAGFVVLRYTQLDLKKRPVQVLEQVARVIRARLAGD